MISTYKSFRIAVIQKVRGKLVSRRLIPRVIQAKVNLCHGNNAGQSKAPARADLISFEHRSPLNASLVADAVNYQLEAGGQTLTGTVPAASLTITSDGWVIDAAFLKPLLQTLASATLVALMVERFS